MRGLLFVTFGGGHSPKRQHIGTEFTEIHLSAACTVEAPLTLLKLLSSVRLPLSRQFTASCAAINAGLATPNSISACIRHISRYICVERGGGGASCSCESPRWKDRNTNIPSSPDYMVFVQCADTRFPRIPQFDRVLILPVVVILIVGLNPYPRLIYVMLSYSFDGSLIKDSG